MSACCNLAFPKPASGFVESLLDPVIPPIWGQSNTRRDILRLFNPHMMGYRWGRVRQEGTEFLKTRFVANLEVIRTK